MSTTLPGIVDHHVHLGLVDHARLAGGPVVEVHDLGWAPDEILRLRSDPPPGVAVRVAGPFHTAPGGYPSGRSWAPAASVVAVADPAAADRAVERAVEGGYNFFKIALNSSMPLLDDATLHALVQRARQAGLLVLVHAEGQGQPERAIAAGADVLVHAPWTHRLDEAALQAGRHLTWYSTLAIHEPREREIATDNIRRFRALGGRVLYGTDMGNGPTPVGLNAEEILALGAAGLEGEELLAALTGDGIGAMLTSPHDLPGTAEEFASWYADARRA